MKKITARLAQLLFLAIIIACAGCVTRSEYQELEARIDSLENRLEELQNLPEQLLAQSKRALEQRDYAAGFELAGRLIERHPNTPEAREVENMRQVTEARFYAAAWSLPASDLRANIEAYSELARLNPSQPVYREKITYYTQRQQAQSRRSSAANTSGGKGYRNSEGAWVPSPALAPSPPAGASAQCRDGTYSFSQSRRGTCSHHGGVARWL